VSQQIDERRIIFFDGVCNLCNAWVDLLIRLDKQKIFYFAPLQGSTAEAVLGNSMARIELRSVVFYNGGQLLFGSDAVIAVLSELRGLNWAGWLAKFLPQSLRQNAYDWVATKRYALFGQRDACRLPTPEERARFLP
jgi:predicted DCC family thiol-disulfide oxidoreductase YuxK